MNKPANTKTSSAGGFFIAALTMIGVIAGGFLGQPSIGLLAGLGLGTAIAILIWWRERGN
jgi:hypothetical protein